MMDANNLPISLKPYAKFISGYGRSENGHCSVYLDAGWQFKGMNIKHRIGGYTPQSTAEYFTYLQPCNCDECKAKLDAEKPQIGNLTLTSKDELVKFLESKMNKPGVE